METEISKLETYQSTLPRLPLEQRSVASVLGQDRRPSLILRLCMLVLSAVSVGACELWFSNAT